MATFLKMVSGIYLVLVWLPVLGLFTGLHTPTLDASLGETGTKALAILVAVGLTIPAAVMFGFAQIVSDVRAMRNNARIQGEHLAAMRRYYDPPAV